MHSRLLRLCVIVLWPPLALCFYAAITLAAIKLENRVFIWQLVYGASACRGWGGDACFWAWMTATSVMSRMMVMSGISIAVASLIEFVAEGPFRAEPYFSGRRRPHYTLADRARGHAKFFRDSLLTSVIDVLIVPVEDYNELRTEEWEPVPGSYLASYCVLASAVFAALLLSDALYYAVHVMQHRLPGASALTGHGYHHTFRFPLAAAGPWLAPLDMLVSGVCTFILPVEIVLTLCRFLGWMRYPGFYDTLLTCYIHEMNHSDHCGKQVRASCRPLARVPQHARQARLASGGLPHRRVPRPTDIRDVVRRAHSCLRGAAARCCRRSVSL